MKSFVLHVLYIKISIILMLANIALIFFEKCWQNHTFTQNFYNKILYTELFFPYDFITLIYLQTVLPRLEFALTKLEIYTFF